MTLSWKQVLTKKAQKVFWVYLTKNFIIRNANDFKKDAEPQRSLIPITSENCERVVEFREEDRISDYRDKLARGEVGFFAEQHGQVVGSIWATINKNSKTRVAKAYMPLQPNEALVHDIVTGGKFRGRGVGPFMVGRIADILLNAHGVGKVIIDVSVKNTPSLRMMTKAGVPIETEMLYVSAFGTLVYQKVVRRFG